MPNLYNCELGWYCLKTHPKKEHLAVTFLQKRGEMDAFSPRIRFTKKTARGKVRFVEALFPGYAFVRTPLKDTFRHVMSMQGVRGIVSYGTIVPRIPDRFIEEIRSRLREDGEPVEDADPPPQVGSAVTVTDGPFLNWNGIITGVVPAKHRVKVLLELLGQQINVELPTEVLHMDASESPHQRVLRC